MLVGGQLLSSSADECIAMLADFDPEEAQRLRQVLAVHHGDGNELMLSVGSILGTPEATLVTDATKEGIVCRKVRAQYCLLYVYLSCGRVYSHGPHCTFLHLQKGTV